MVLRRLFNARSKTEPARLAIPGGERVYAIGDIHGRLDLLEELLAIIAKDDAARPTANTTLIFLGDLVDRGPQSRQVIDRLIALKEKAEVETRFLMGNHDEVFLKAAAGDVKAVRMLTRIGGRETILSYDVDEEEYLTCDYDELATLIARAVPPAHLEFLESFQDYLEFGDYLFVHAGIRPGVPLSDQKPADLRWIRGEFLKCQNPHDKMVVHGHSISDDVDVQRNRIGIDTGAFYSGRLSAIGIEGEDRWALAAVGSEDPRWGPLSD